MASSKVRTMTLLKLEKPFQRNGISVVTNLEIPLVVMEDLPLESIHPRWGYSSRFGTYVHDNGLMDYCFVFSQVYTVNFVAQVILLPRYIK